MIVTLCGSARFEPWFKSWKLALHLAGHPTFDLAAYPSQMLAGKNWYSDSEKEMLDYVHKEKINASGAILVLNVFGYMGPSTLAEIEHARTVSKVQVYFLESWGKGNGIDTNHYEHIQMAAKQALGEHYGKGSPIDTTPRVGKPAHELIIGTPHKVPFAPSIIAGLNSDNNQHTRNLAAEFIRCLPTQCYEKLGR
jgi:hypothetical protein